MTPSGPDQPAFTPYARTLGLGRVVALLLAPFAVCLVGPSVGSLGGVAAAQVLMAVGADGSAFTALILLGFASGVAGAGLALWLAVHLLFARGFRRQIGVRVGGVGLAAGVVVLLCHFFAMPGGSGWWIPLSMSIAMLVLGRDLPSSSSPTGPPGAPGPPPFPTVPSSDR